MQDEFGGNNSSPLAPLGGPSHDFMLNSSRSSAIESDARVLSDASSCSTQQSVAPSLPSFRGQERTWTLFTQLMENGGQLIPTPLPSDHPLNAASVFSETPRRTTASPAESILYPHNSSAASSKLPDHPEDGHEVHDQSPVFDRSQPNSSIPKEPTHQWISLSPLHRNVLKCSIAYFIGSLFTFCPYLSGLISDLVSYGPGRQGPTPSGHMVATIAVYYNPAKTIGGMLEADIFCVLGLLYASFVCLSCMSLFWWLELQPGWEWLGNVIAIVWIGVSMSIVAWMKAWMGSPTFNTACSMMAIIIFVVLVKEGGLITLLQVSAIVICGSVVSNLTCCIFWPQTATTNLEKNMAQTLGSFSTLLARLTDTFLLENSSMPSNTMQDKLHKAIEDHQNSFTKLRKTLNESRNERLYTSWKDYEGVVDSMNRLAQHLNGLRSSTKLQHELTVGCINRGHAHFDPENLRDPGQSNEMGGLGATAAASVFKALIDELNPSLKALEVACVHTLEKLHEAFEQMNADRQDSGTKLNSQYFAQLIEAIDVALKHFDATSDYAILRAYRQDSSDHDPDDMGSPIRYVKQQGDESAERGPTSTAQEHEIVFLVYFFVFTLEEFAQELILLVECIERVYAQTRRQSNPRLLRSAVRLLSIYRRAKQQQKYVQRLSLRRSLSHIIPMNRRLHSSFPKIHPHAPDTIQTPSWNQLSRTGKFKKVLWTFGEALLQRKSKYAIKAGLATALLASPAFFDATRPLFIEYWGDWALISCFVVLSQTIGATNYLSLHRILGTIFGAAVAAGIFSAFPDHPIILSTFGLVFSMPCFYYALSRPQYASASRFVLLTYNLTCLYSYNLREKYVDVLDIALYRGMAVTVGVLWAAIISRLWLPSEARRELNKELGEFCLNLGWLYTRLVASNSLAFDHHGRHESDAPDSNSSLLIEDRGIILHESVKEFMSMELHLQIKLIEIQGLLAQAQHEPRLKGPFPVLLYRDILTSLQAIMDKLHSVRCVMTREEWCTAVTRDFILPVNKERREMVGNVIVTLSILGSAFHLKAPLPPYLPPCETSRQRLVNAIRKLDIVRERNVKGSRQLLYFAYAITMKGVTEELEKLGRILQSAFGVIGQTPEEFEALFDSFT